MKITITLLLLFVSLAGTVMADMHLTQVNTTEPMEMMGNVMPGRVDTTQIWFAGDKMSFVAAEATSIVRKDLDKMYIVMPSKKSYTELSLVDFEAAREMMEKMSNDQPEESKIGMKMSMTVNKTDQSKKIGDWDCTLYNVEAKMPMGMTANQEIWATKDIDVDFKAMYKAMSGMMAGFEGFEEAMAEMEKIDGLPVEILVSMKVMGASIKSRSELISAEEKTAPDGIYEIPDGFKKVERSMISPH